MLYTHVNIIVAGIKNSIIWESGFKILNADKNKESVCPKVNDVTIQKTFLKSLKLYTIVKAERKSIWSIAFQSKT
jgi:hypothetical protein